MKLSEIFFNGKSDKEPTDNVITCKKQLMAQAREIDDEHQQERDEIIASLYKAKTLEDINKLREVINRLSPHITGTKLWT